MGPTKETKEKLERLKAYLYQLGNKGLTYAEAADFIGTSYGSFKNNFVPRYIDTDPDFKRVVRHGVPGKLYFNPDRRAPIPDQVARYYNDKFASYFKNAEGYSDSTAGKAITNMDEKKEKTVLEDLMPGQAIYISGSSTATMDMFLLYRVFGDTFVGWYVNVDTKPLSLPGVVNWKITEDKYAIVYSHRITSRKREAGIKYELAKTQCPMHEYRELIRMFGGNTVEITVEKVVEKPAVAPMSLQIGQEGLTAVVKADDKLHTELLLHMQRADIYEKAFYALIKGGVEED